MVFFYYPAGISGELPGAIPKGIPEEVPEGIPGIVLVEIPEEVFGEFLEGFPRSILQKKREEILEESHLDPVRVRKESRKYLLEETQEKFLKGSC